MSSTMSSPNLYNSSMLIVFANLVICWNFFNTFYELPWLLMVFLLFTLALFLAKYIIRTREVNSIPRVLCEWPT